MEPVISTTQAMYGKIILKRMHETTLGVEKH